MANTHFSGPLIVSAAIINGYASTATAAGTTILNSNSAGRQYFTGSTTQTIKMPVAYAANAALPLGYEIEFTNNSSGTITIQDSAAGAIGTVASGARKKVTLTDNSTAAGTWNIL
jgi:hypothetical protein